LYAIISYSVSERTNEIGIRMALGAQPKDVLKQVLMQGLKLALLGIVIGLIGAYILTGVMASLLYGVSTRDLTTFAIVPVILIVVTLIACYFPARRATKVDPVIALRFE
jgi:putative ABC transport system permease protein